MGNKYFYIGGLISLLIYSLIIVIVFFDIISSSDALKYSKKSETRFEVTLVSTPKIEEKQVVEKPKDIVKEIIKKEEPIKKDEGGSSKDKVVDTLDSLFADVSDTVSEVYEKKLITKKPTVQSRKVGQVKRVTSSKASDMINKIKFQNKKIIFESSDGIDDPYFSKVQQIIASKWNPQSEDFGLAVTLILRLSITGELKSYKILKFSGDERFDRKMTTFIDSLKNVDFGINTKESIIEFTFKIEE